MTLEQAAVPAVTFIGKWFLVSLVLGVAVAVLTFPRRKK